MIMAQRDRPIGIFDSGIGGLTVVREIIKELPDEKIVYFGDTARLPYGNKSARTVIKFSLENVKLLLKFGVKFIIVACNTSSSLALPALRRRFKVPILGVIRPAVEKAVRITPAGRIGIIGTRATIGSSCYQREIRKIGPGCKSFAQACPLFVPLAEEGWINDEVTLKVARRYLGPMRRKNIDTLILGCTHYPLLKKMIRKAVGARIKFVDSAKEAALEAKRMLTRDGLRRRRASGLPGYRFFVSDEPERFRRTGRRFLGKKIEFVEKV